MKNTSAVQRVDLQVTVLVAFLLIIAATVVFFFAYTLSYRQMLQTLEDRVSSLALYVDKELPSSLFTQITTSEDMSSQEYKDAKLFLSRVREISSAKYLYTAARNKDGQLIYHIDGLPRDDKDFRKPGDLIEKDFQADLNLALDGHIVMPGDIKNTEWGDVFVAYYPVHSKEHNTIIGAIGVEFPATREYEAFSQIRFLTPFVIFMTCLVGSILSHFLFRRISNPHFKDLSNTDSLTGLKSRNSYDLDISNLIQSKKVKKFALVLADLNGLKSINDQQGHAVGDMYIQQFAKVIMKFDSKYHVSYRIGGDEFASFFFNPTEQELEEFMQNIKKALKNSLEIKSTFSGVSMGYALADELTQESWKQVQAEADVALYEDKKAFYATHSKFDNRR